jgi:hypothetical protein
MSFILEKSHNFTSKQIPNEVHSWFCVFGSIVMLGLGIWTIWSASLGLPPATTNWSSDSNLLILALFLTLFPPMFLFADYYAYACEAVSLPPNAKDITAYLGGLKDFIELGAAVWAGFGAVFAGLLSRIDK